MKLISFSRCSYLISLILHLSVLISFVYISYKPKSHIRSFQTSVFFESSAINKKRVRAQQRPSILKPTLKGSLSKPILKGSLSKPTLKGSLSKPTLKGSLSKKLNLDPGIKKKSTIFPKTESFRTPSLKKRYITPPKPAPFQMEEPTGFLRKNKRTGKPVLPIIAAEEPPENQQQSKPSSAVQSGSEKSGSKSQTLESEKPFIPDPSSIETDSHDTTSSKSRGSSVWQKKSDLMVYRNSLAKLVTANWIVPPTSVKEFQILIAAYIGPRGNLISIQPIKRSGLAILDAAAERAIRVSTPFPEFPKSFQKDLTAYRAVFRFTPDKVAN